MSKPIPYTIIGGYLGAGKTTLLNNLLRNSRGLRLAVLVNDFGDVNIDAELIASQDGETISLANGCICCSLSDGFMAALSRLRERADVIDHIVVEASGISDPVRIGQYGAILRYELDGVIVVADAEQIRDKAANKYVGETVIRQLRGADLLVLNKVDLVSPAQLAEVRAWLQEIAPNVSIVEATCGDVPIAVLMGQHSDRQRDVVEAQVAPGHHDHVHQEAYQTWTFEAKTPIRMAALSTALDALPAGVLRAKGFVHLVENSRRYHVLQLVGNRRSLTPGEPWGDREAATRLVFIGLPGSIGAAEIETQLTAAGRCKSRAAWDSNDTSVGSVQALGRAAPWLVRALNTASASNGSLRTSPHVVSVAKRNL